MGAGIIPAFNPSLTNIVYNSNGKLLGYYLDELDEISRAYDVTPFGDFNDTRVIEIPENFDGNPIELLDQSKRTDWYDIDDGIKTLKIMIEVIPTHKKSGIRKKHKKKVLSDLALIQRTLESAKETSPKFRLEMR